jgi:four helix bundle protein
MRRREKKEERRKKKEELSISSFFALPSSFFALPSSIFLLLSSFNMSDLRQRTKAFALRIIRLYSALPQTTVAQVLGKQVLRSGTSVGAHYKEAIRARSSAEYISKIQVGLQEIEETAYWLELITEAGIINAAKIQDLLQETQEITAILGTLVKKAQENPSRKKIEDRK